MIYSRCKKNSKLRNINLINGEWVCCIGKKKGEVKIKGNVMSNTVINFGTIENK